MPAVDLDGLAVQWESSRDLRNRFREHHSLFDHTIGSKSLDVNIVCAEHHVDVLLPLVKKLHNKESGETGMCTIPALEQEWLALRIICCGVVWVIFLANESKWNQTVLGFETSSLLPTRQNDSPHKANLFAYVAFFISIQSRYKEKIEKEKIEESLKLGRCSLPLLKGPNASCSTSIVFLTPKSSA